MQGSVAALVAMAFFAVIREGFETSVFLLAAFDSSTIRSRPAAARCSASSRRRRSATASTAAASGSNLTRFFRATGLVLVLVAAGLVATALHTAHEAGWLNSLQGQTVDPALALVGPAQSGALAAHGPARLPAASGDARRRSATLSTRSRWRSTCSGRRGSGSGANGRRNRARRAHGMTGARVLAATCVAAALALAGCGGGDRQKSAKRRSVDVKLTDAGCEPRRASPRCRSDDVRGRQRRRGRGHGVRDPRRRHILGEVENLAPGLSGHFSLTLKPGRFTMYCPGGKSERGPLVVTGTAGAASRRPLRRQPATGATWRPRRRC
jgi:hypothetical protein